MTASAAQKFRPRPLVVTAVALMSAFALAGCANDAGGDADGNGDAAANGETETDTEDAETDQQDTESPEGNGTESPEGTGAGADQQAPLATANLADADGNEVGQVDFTETDGGVEVSVTAENMDPGFFGFHLHEVGECEPDSEAPDDPEDTGDFMSAGSHIAGEEDADHPDHAGDLPVLLVKEDGAAQMSVVTDRVDESLLLDDDGAAVIIHSDEDNFAHVPDRYLDDSEPDDDTVSTGDAGDRLACGVVEQ